MAKRGIESDLCDEGNKAARVEESDDVTEKNNLNLLIEAAESVAHGRFRLNESSSASFVEGADLIMDPNLKCVDIYDSFNDFTRKFSLFLTSYRRLIKYCERYRPETVTLAEFNYHVESLAKYERFFALLWNVRYQLKGDMTITGNYRWPTYPKVTRLVRLIESSDNMKKNSTNHTVP